MALLLSPPSPPDTLAVLSVHPRLNSLGLETPALVLRLGTRRFPVSAAERSVHFSMRANRGSDKSCSNRCAGAHARRYSGRLALATMPGLFYALRRNWRS